MKYLDDVGFSYFWGKLKTLLQTKSDVGHTHTDKFTNHSQGSYNCNTCHDEGVYLISKGSNCPSGSQYGSLFVMPYRKPTGNTKPDYGVQLFIPNGDDAKPYFYFRTSHSDSWDSWQILTRGDYTITTSDSAPTSAGSNTITLVI